MLEHGGNLREAAARYAIPMARWLDLSTGINPLGYAPPDIPDAAWGRLPQEQDGLEQAAAAYYGTTDILPLPGSQSAIQWLPRLRSRSRVGVLAPSYAEHAHAWRQGGHDVRELHAAEIGAHLKSLDVLVLANPNNPTGETFPLEQLRAWHAQLAMRGGWLVVDEAFHEAGHCASLVQAHMPQGLIVLRSIGKFFGLAGARVGFLLAHEHLRTALREHLGPWSVPGPSRYVVQHALRDSAWQQATRERLSRDGARLAQLLRSAGLAPAGGCGLFQWVQTERAPVLHEQMAREGILTRLYNAPASLRFGLPGAAAEWQRLSEVLHRVGVAA